jgi:ABC-type nitrate/sulfonate/bicarbonate transport system substrate-binding protein
MKKTIFALALFALLIIGCAKETQHGVIRYLGYKIYDPVYIAQDKGFFGKYGVTVEISDLLAGGPTGLQAVAGGSAESCTSSYMAVIAARAQGLPILAVTDLQSAIGTQALEEFFVRKDSGIDSIADLKGKTIAINLVKSSFHYTWLMALDAAGLSETDVDFIILPFDQQELALANSRVDAIGLMQPYVLHAKQNADLKVLYTALDVFGAKQFSAHVVNKVWAENNPALIRGFVAAIVEAVTWIETNQNEAKLIIEKYTGTAPEYIEEYHYQENAGIITADAQYWLDYMRDRGEVTAGWLRVEDFATNEYNPNRGMK